MTHSPEEQQQEFYNTIRDLIFWLAIIPVVILTVLAISISRHAVRQYEDVDYPGIYESHSTECFPSGKTLSDGYDAGAMRLLIKKANATKLFNPLRKLRW